RSRPRSATIAHPEPAAEAEPPPLGLLAIVRGRGAGRGTRRSPILNRPRKLDRHRAGRAGDRLRGSRPRCATIPLRSSMIVGPELPDRADPSPPANSGDKSVAARWGPA